MVNIVQLDTEAYIGGGGDWVLVLGGITPPLEFWDKQGLLTDCPYNFPVAPF